MRQKKFVSPYIILGAILFCFLNVSKPSADEMRLFTVSNLSPVWKWTKKFQNYLSDRPGRFWKEKNEADAKRLAQLELENTILRTEIEKISKWLANEQKTAELFERFKTIEVKKDQAANATLKSFYERRLSHLLALVQSELMAMPAEVIYRSPSSWSSSLWVNVGEEDNRAIGYTVIGKNSPVVLGSTLVGIVDYVGKKQSKVRLITDSGLSPAVRAVRGEIKNREALSLAEKLLERIDGKEVLVRELKMLKSEWEGETESTFLAKGELHGSGKPLWRSLNPQLIGVGFNFDYPDADGTPPKDVPLIQKGDLLVTTGFDGVFPPDLQVGIVSHVATPKSGGYAYEIDVSPIEKNLNNLEMVFILPPRSD